MILRFGPAAVTARIQRALSGSRSQMRTAEMEAITGRKVDRPSDAPTRRAAIDRFRAGIAAQQTHGDNASRAQQLWSTTENALAESSDIMKRASEIAVQMANDILSPESRQVAAVEVDTLREQLIDLSNTSVSGRHVFGGTAYDQAAFNPQGVYQGTNDVPETLVADGQTMELGMDGQQVFAGSEDLFVMLDELAVNLRANDPDAVSGMIGRVRDGLEHLIGQRSQAGLALRRAGDASETATNLSEMLQGSLANEVEVDPVEAYTRLTELRGSYEAALAVSAKSAGPRLFDFMS